MRFLLHQNPSITSKVVGNIGRSTQVKITPMIDDDQDDKNTSSVMKTWGQKCSHNCSCALRFETNVDTSKNNRIISASYTAKKILSKIVRNDDGTAQNKPILTQKGRPLMKDCSCETLHSLAESIIRTLPTLTLSQAQNQLEFTGIRSSLAFRYSVLKHHNLIQAHENKNNNKNKITFKTNFQRNKHQNDNNNLANDIAHIVEGPCFDLVEEALVACIKGYSLSPRVNSTSLYQDVSAYSLVSRSNEDNYDDYDQQNSYSATPNYLSDLNPLRFVQAAKRQSSEMLYTSFIDDTTTSLRKNDQFSTSSSSNSFTSNDMPPFHFMHPISDDESLLFPTDTLLQIKADLQREKNDSENHYKGKKDGTAPVINDWVSYVDQLHRLQDEHISNTA